MGYRRVGMEKEEVMVVDMVHKLVQVQVERV
uniref:Uncharacterized protein n=1 Tax=Lepeophtheirus salmonis TaxID=72036 RepID=A0A0K2VA51_LEPSM